VGAILGNILMTEFVILALSLICLVVFGVSYERVLVALFITGLLFPVLFYHHSWSFWLGFDYLIESLPKYEKR